MVEKAEKALKTNLVLTSSMIEKLDAVKRAIGAATRSETIRSLIREKYAQLSQEDKGDARC